jgi:hypothetical protein
MAIRVFHCDDSEAFTRLVAFWLAEHEDIEHAGQAHSAQSALAALSPTSCCSTRSASPATTPC